MEDKELIAMINAAIPLSDCAVKRSHEIWRRQKLLKNLKAYIEKQLSEQFNAVRV